MQAALRNIERGLLFPGTDYRSERLLVNSYFTYQHYTTVVYGCIGDLLSGVVHLYQFIDWIIQGLHCARGQTVKGVW